MVHDGFGLMCAPGVHLWKMPLKDVCNFQMSDLESILTNKDR